MVLRLQKLDQKYLEGSEMLCWRRMEFISWTDHVKKGTSVIYSGAGKEKSIYNKTEEC
jgi:hypothetical protein